MLKNVKILFLIFILLFTYLVALVSANEGYPLPPSMQELVKNMQHQIEGWISKLEEMEKDPYLPTSKRAIIKTLKDILIKTNKLLDGLSPSKPKIKKTEGLTAETAEHTCPPSLPVCLVLLHDGGPRSGRRALRR
jgi:hypothetical protein